MNLPEIHPISKMMEALPNKSIQKKKLQRYPSCTMVNTIISNMKIMKMAKRTPYNAGFCESGALPRIQESDMNKVNINKAPMKTCMAGSFMNLLIFFFQIIQVDLVGGLLDP